MADRDVLVALRDDEFHRWMGAGADDPRPTWCITVDGDVVGWTDFESGQDFLGPGEVNVGWAVGERHRGQGLVTRAVRLMVSALPAERAVAMIDTGNVRSQRVAQRSGFREVGPHGDHNVRYERTPPPRTYSDGTVTIRPWRLEDVEAHVAGTDEEQIRWLWPEHRETWTAMSPEERIAHVRGVFERAIAENETGPKWSFGVHVADVLVGHVDCDLANEHVPRGEANVSYTVWPEHRGRGHAAAATRLVLEFVREHTGAREAHVLVDPDNAASLRVARSLRGTVAVGGPMVRHVVSLRT